MQNLSQLASINHDVLLQNSKDVSRCSSPGNGPTSQIHICCFEFLSIVLTHTQANIHTHTYKLPNKGKNSPFFLILEDISALQGQIVDILLDALSGGWLLAIKATIQHQRVDSLVSFSFFIDDSVLRSRQTRYIDQIWSPLFLLCRRLLQTRK